MDKENIPFPRSIKITAVMLSTALLLVFIYYAQNILIPLLLSLIFAILLRPVVVFFNTRLRFPNVIAVLIVVVLFIIVISGVVFFVSWQIADVANDWKTIQRNLTIHYLNMQIWITKHLHLSQISQQTYLEQLPASAMSGTGGMLDKTINSLTEIVLIITLTPIYIFLMLLYRNLFVKFLSKIISKTNAFVVADILHEVKIVIQSYVTGLLIETAVVAFLTTGGLMLLGVPYAVLLGIITALLNLIPYIGIMIASFVTILAALANTSSLSVVIGVLAMSIVVQFIDNNILIPRIVGNKVRINALVSMLAVIIGGTIAGIPGMFLAIPLIAIIKVVFDRIESLSPFGYLMGDDLSKTYNWFKIKLPNLNEGSEYEPWPVQERENTVAGQNQDQSEDLTKRKS
jgi:predicted PurR-regulated permease PerM